MSGSGISWDICKSAPLQTDNHASTPPLIFYRPDALPAAQSTASKHWRHKHWNNFSQNMLCVKNIRLTCIKTQTMTTWFFRWDIYCTVTARLHDFGSAKTNVYLVTTITKGWWRGTVVERRSLAGELSLSCARPAADGWPLMWVGHPLQVSQLGQLSLSSFRGR